MKTLIVLSNANECQNNYKEVLNDKRLKSKTKSPIMFSMSIKTNFCTRLNKFILLYFNTSAVLCSKLKLNFIN